MSVGGEFVKKTFGMYIDSDLLLKLDEDRRKESLRQGRDISRSEYFTDLIKKGHEIKKG